MLSRNRGLLVMALILGAVVLFGAVADAQAANSSSNRLAPYLRMGTGARALGMGGAFTGVADDATAAYWNPAGLAWTSGWEVTGMYSAGMNVDRQFNYVGLSHNTPMLAYALQWVNAGMSDIPQYDDNMGFKGNFNYGDNAFSLSLAKGFDMASVGITGKFLRQSVGADIATDDAVNGFGLDLGLGLVLTDYARFGLSVANIASKLGSVDEVNTIPATLRAGVAVMPMEGLTVAFDMEKTRDEEDYAFHAGGEYALALGDDFGTALRIGMNRSKFAGGIGLRYNFLTFDYAYVVEPEKFLGENHRFSVSLNFGREEAIERKVSDRDGDGIPDDVDQCPDLAEDFDGYQDSDGCPEGGPPKVEAPPAPVAAPCPPPPPPGIPTFAYINFKFGTAEISGADPIPVLEDVARIMKERPDVKVKITGHTDNVGSDEANMTLSMRRADAIKTYLIGRGVGADRLFTDGKGESMPIDTNDTDLGRARNRRIEFSVIQ
jgi:outer membrane protein OmpA-like peptidoglycan-associated protein